MLSLDAMTQTGLQSGDDLLELDGALWIWARPLGQPVYDFTFDRLFECRRPYAREERVVAVGRVGAFEDYGATYEALDRDGIQLINDPAQHTRATRLPHWYPLIEDLTPKSIVFTGRPDPDVIASELGWPIFMKGERQTNRHRRSLSILHGADDLERALDAYAKDPVLSWQQIVCRQLAPLRPVEDPDPDRIPSSFEFRTFWRLGRPVGCGRYWWQGAKYELDESERAAALNVAGEAARRVDVPFVMIDIAQEESGRWIVIECNDAQESGYAGVSRPAMWRSIIDLQRESPGTSEA